MGNLLPNHFRHGHYCTSRCKYFHHSVGQIPVGHPSQHQAAGPGETEEAFNNYMERVIGKTFIILSIFNSIHP